MNDETTLSAVVSQTKIRRLTSYVLRAMLVLPLFAGIFAYRLWVAEPAISIPTNRANAATVISTETLEARFGVQIRLLGVTAAGGMIDFRYKVIDKAKAAFLVGAGSTPPVLLVEASDTILTLDTTSHGMKHNTDLENDTIYFHFFPNRQNAVKPGTAVTVIFGSVHLAPLQAQ